MTITTYPELQTQVADFLNRQDLTAQVPTFIALAEASMNRKLRHWRMERRSTATVDAQYSAVPMDWMETMRFGLSGTGQGDLRLLPHVEMAKRREACANTAGRPQFYALSAGEFEFLPTPDEEYTAELIYYGKIPALTDSNTTNWLLDLAPDAYLYGALVHSAPYLQEDSRIQVWGGLYADTINGLNQESEAAKYSGSGLKMKTGAS